MYSNSSAILTRHLRAPVVSPVQPQIGTTFTLWLQKHFGTAANGATNGRTANGTANAPNSVSTMQAPVTGAAPVDFEMLPTTPVLDIEYTQGYLKSQIGKRVKVEFLIGTNMLIDREGTLVDVGISYIIINEVETDDLLLCDIYSIKFVRFYF